jgi:hypothetical protein
MKDEGDVDLFPDLFAGLFVEDVGDEGEEETDEEALRVERSQLERKGKAGRSDKPNRGRGIGHRRSVGER